MNVYYFLFNNSITTLFTRTKNINKYIINIIIIKNYFTNIGKINRVKNNIFYLHVEVYVIYYTYLFRQ